MRCMSLNIKHIMILLVYAFSINLIILQFANMGIGIDCNNMIEQGFNTTYNQIDFDSSELKQSSA